MPRFTALIVEDEPILRMCESEFLSEHGFRTLEAANGNDAKVILSSESVDVVVTDVRMNGDRDGILLAKWARDARPGLPVVIASASDPKVAKRELGQEQVFLSKPVDNEVLLKAIEAVLPDDPEARIAACTKAPRGKRRGHRANS